MANSRYEFPEDRFDFHLWVEAPGPCAEPYWRFDSETNNLVIDITRKGDRMCYVIPKECIEDSRPSWRQLVARAVRLVRHALVDAQRQTQAAAQQAKTTSRA